MEELKKGNQKKIRIFEHELKERGRKEAEKCDVSQMNRIWIEICDRGCPQLEM